MTVQNPIAVFYHCLFSIGSRAGSSVEPARTPLEPGPLPAAIAIVRSQIEAMTRSGLLDAADRIFIGVNGGLEALEIVADLLPAKAVVHLHGLGCRNELRTLLMLEGFVDEVSRLDAETDWLVCYHHAKGASHPVGDDQNARWRRCMERHVIGDWRSCVAALKQGYDAAGAHYLTPPSTPDGHRIFAGNFFWARSRYMATVTPLLDRERIRTSGVETLESRYEAEVYVGNGRKPPRVFDLHPGFDSFDGCESVTPQTKED